MAKSIRAHAHADISLPEGWNSENTSIAFSVVVKREDTSEKLPQDSIQVEVDEIQEYEDD